MEVSGVAVIGAALGAMGAFFGLPPINREVVYRLNNIWPNALPESTQLIEMRFRGLISDDEYFENMKKFGYNRDWAEKIFQIHKRLYSLDMLLTMYFRKVISEEEFYQQMEILGYTKDQSEKILKIAWYYPSVSDWIRFAVRDVFNEKIVEKYSYDEEFPEHIVEFAKQAGIDEQTLRWYWRAHWDLPSAIQGYEMLHRLSPEVLDTELPDGTKYGDKYRELGLNPEEIKTDLDTLRELLKIADIPKYWRDRLIAIAYAPLTRVDLRRIYALGLISDEEVLARLMEYGYTRKDAELLLEWFRMEKQPEERELSKTEILKLYRERFIDEAKARELLKALNYSDDEIDYLLILEDYKLYNEFIEERLKTLRLLFVRGLIDIQEYYNELARLELPALKIEHELEIAQREKMKALKLPSKAELDKMFKMGIITEDEYKKTLKLIGYSEEWIERFVKLVRVG